MKVHKVVKHLEVRGRLIQIHRALSAKRAGEDVHTPGKISREV